MTVRRLSAVTRWSSLGLLALLSACATRPASDGAMPWTSGKLSLRVEAIDDRPVQSLPATFDLRGSGDIGELRLTSPLGTLIAVVRWSGQRAALQLPDGEREFPDLDTLSREVLGEPLPLRALPDWIAGRPWPGATVDRRGNGGFDQLGWTLDLTRFDQGSLVATRSAPPAVTLRVRIERPG